MMFNSSFQGLDTLVIDTPLARCEISLFGAHVLSYIPKHDGRDLLWCSASRLLSGKPVRGGIPICWPWFAKQEVLPGSAQHGFVRTQLWTLLEHNESPAGEVYLRLGAPPVPTLPPESSPWPQTCSVQVELRIGSTLQQSMMTHNDSDQTLRLTQAMHSYFRVSDVRQVAVPQLQGLSFLDKLLDFKEARQNSPWAYKDSCDRIYLDTGSRFELIDPVWERKIIIESEQSRSTVVWNAGPEGVKAFNDIPNTDWPQYLCIEVANCGPRDQVSLPPGQSHRLTQRLGAMPL